MRRRLLAIAAVAAIAAVVVILFSGGAGIGKPGRGPLGFQLTIARSVANAPLTGRAFVILSRTNEDEPRFQIDTTGVPFFGRDVSAVQPGTTITLGRSGVYGYPLTSLRKIPPGDYYVQAFFNVYTKFSRSDGSVVWLHMPGGDGQDPFTSPGNLYSAVKKIHLNPASAGTVKLVLNQVIEPEDPVPPGGTPQQGNPADTAHVKHLKIQSQLLSEFWGTPIFIAANVLLPEGYDASGDPYPVVYQHGHYPGPSPYSFREDLGNDFSKWWVKADTPKMIVVTMRHENPYYDDSYAVNSANLGPYGDAITQELMPAIDAAFNTVPERWGRTLTGGSTGGWEVLAQMIFYPELYQGVWAFSPDPVDFRFHQLVNVYADESAYYNLSEWVKVPRPASRSVQGDTRLTMAQENHFELALGTHSRSGWGQWDIWQAVYGPQGADGYPAPIWNKLTGQIDPAVAEAWKQMDLRIYLEENWATVGPQLAGRLHVFAGDDDNYFLNNAVELLEQFLSSTTSPAANAEFQYGRNGGHSWRPYDTYTLLTTMYNAMHP